MELGTLASLNDSDMTFVGKYLNAIEIKKIEITQITIGLTRKDKQWIWKDGTVYDDSNARLGDENNFAVLAWSEPKKKWSLKGVVWLLDSLHLCERPKSM